MPVGRQAGAGGFVWQEEGTWRLGTKPGTQLAGAEAGLGRQVRLGCQWGRWSVGLGPAPFSLATSHGGLGSLMPVEGAVELQPVMVVHCLPQSLFRWVVGKTGV